MPVPRFAQYVDGLIHTQCFSDTNIAPRGIFVLHGGYVRVGDISNIDKTPAHDDGVRSRQYITEDFVRGVE